MVDGNREIKPFLYVLSRFLIKSVLAIFFRKIEVRHAEYIPARGAVLIVANHPNSIMDALVLGTVTNRKVNYVGHAGLFSNRLKSWFLHGTGVIPVYRRQDAPDKVDANIYMFQACFEALEQGGMIGIFPEGTSDMLRKVKKIKTGAARIALEGERRNAYNLNLTLLPVGLYFVSRSRFRSRVLVNIGPAIALDGFVEMNEQDNVRAVQALTEEIQRRLERVTVNIRDEELDQFVRDIEWLYREDLKRETLGGTNKHNTTTAEFVLTQKIAECAQYYYRHDASRLLSLRDRVNTYKRKLRRLRLSDMMLRDKGPGMGPVRRFVDLAALVLGFPAATYGIINNFLPYRLAEKIAEKFIDEKTKILLALMIGGGAAFTLFYVAQVAAVWVVAGEAWALCYFISLPSTGLFALSYIKFFHKQRERLSLSLFLYSNRLLFDKMRLERKRLIAEFDAVKDEYMGLMNVDAPMVTTEAVNDKKKKDSRNVSGVSGER